MNNKYNSSVIFYQTGTKTILKRHLQSEGVRIHLDGYESISTEHLASKKFLESLKKHVQSIGAPIIQCASLGKKTYGPEYLLDVFSSVYTLEVDDEGNAWLELYRPEETRYANWYQQTGINQPSH